MIKRSSRETGVFCSSSSRLFILMPLKLLKQQMLPPAALWASEGGIAALSIRDLFSWILVVCSRTAGWKGAQFMGS